MAQRITPRSAIAEGDVKHPVRTECDRAAIVVTERLRDLQHDRAGGRVGHVRIFRHVVAGDARAARRAIRVVHEKPAVLGKVGVDGHPEEPTLTLEAGKVGDVEEGTRQECAILNDTNSARTLDHEETVRVARRRRDEHGLIHVPDHDLQRQLQPGWWRLRARQAGRIYGVRSRIPACREQHAHENREVGGSHSVLLFGPGCQRPVRCDTLSYP